MWLFQAFVSLCIIVALHSVFCGSPCPKRELLKPCSCHEIPKKSVDSKVFTLVVCHQIEGISELNQVVENLQQLTIDRFVVFNSTVEKCNNSQQAQLSTTPPTTSDIYLDYQDYYRYRPTPAPTRPPKLPSDLWNIESVQIREIVFQDFSSKHCVWEMNTWSGFYEHLTSITVKNGSIRQTGFCMTELAEFSNLDHLDLSENGIGGSGHDLPIFPSSMSKLRKLDLSYNEIVNITSGTFSDISLSILNLSHNRITSIQRNIFPDEDRTLKELNLSWNLIESLPNDILLSMAAIRKLNLAHNRIQVVTSGIVEINRSLKLIDLTGNFLNCNCSMSWAASDLEESAVKNRPLVLQVKGVCNNPRHLESKDISDFTNYDNCPGKQPDEKK